MFQNLPRFAAFEAHGLSVLPSGSHPRIGSVSSAPVCWGRGLAANSFDRVLAVKTECKQEFGLQTRVAGVFGLKRDLWLVRGLGLMVRFGAGHMVVEGTGCRHVWEHAARWPRPYHKRI